MPVVGPQQYLYLNGPTCSVSVTGIAVVIGVITVVINCTYAAWFCVGDLMQCVAS